MFDNKGRFVIENYGEKSTFASFLPGISGKYGIPIWCYYVNRGQCVTSFGVSDKDHAIMEFYPAHQAYQNTQTVGFRTFLKKDGKYIEPFENKPAYKKMAIGMNELSIEAMDEENKLEIQVLYYTLPNERVGALVRKVTVVNRDSKEAVIELLDGMPALIPYGVDMNSMKTMGQTTKAWMQVEDVESKLPFFRVRVSMNDSADVKKVEGGNFYFAMLENGERLFPLVDPDVVFDYDTAMNTAVGFDKHDVDDLLEAHQVTQNNVPCCFFGKKKTLKPGESIQLYEIIGQVESKELLHKLSKKCCNVDYFDKKYEEAIRLTEELCQVIDTKTADSVFDAYCRQTYLDNLLRGGYPVALGTSGKKKIFYLYSRKHGDIERDYNYFRMLPEYYSQGNGNFRDVNQNRRCDILFTPFVGDSNIKTFYSFIQIDGYNPLAVEKITYSVKEENREALLALVSEKNKADLDNLLKCPFTPGSLVMQAEEYEFTGCHKVDEFLQLVMDSADSEVNGDFGEGYWSDHWTYNLDLIENYLCIYPDREEDLIFNDDSYTYFETKVKVNPRSKRYVKTENGIRQYSAIDANAKKDVSHKQMKTGYGKGDTAVSNLAEKLILLCTMKYAALDPYGMGVEMEGGKPGWYDALNGMPGLFGSSMAETYELCRMLEFTISCFETYHKPVALFDELADLMDKLYKITGKYEKELFSDKEVLDYWKEINKEKEDYRTRTAFGVDGHKTALSDDYLIEVLKQWHGVVKNGIEKAIGYGDGICPTYFTFEMTRYKEENDAIEPLAFEVRPVPLFLEGPVRYLKLHNSREHKRVLYQKIKESDLYDRNLSMYKVNASLSEASYELGRAKAFTPGWLENESIWLHMEYKYILELLKSRMYEEFMEDLHLAAVPFLDPKVYGRSILENSSFIASSKNPNKKFHGKGFVARLSGSTAEFIQMWQIMMFGSRPFAMDGGKLVLRLSPLLPDYLVGDEKEIRAAFLGTTGVTYRLNEPKNYIPGNYRVEEYCIRYHDGSEERIEGEAVYGSAAEKIRDGLAASIDVKLV